jgi:hypothetical protein
MRRPLLTVLLAAVSALPSGCALLSAGPVATVPVPLADAPAPASLRAAVEPARRALEETWTGPLPVRFTFDAGRCAVGAPAVLAFRTEVGGVPAGYALALTHDLAAGILTGAWWTAFDVADPATDAEAARLLGANEVPCP